MKNFSVVMTGELHKQLVHHLVREDLQEDLCFATYNPSTGSKRSTGIISSIILPNEGEREVHGNVEFHPAYLERAISMAVERKEGLVFIHSHPFPGWQGMSDPDIVAETRISPAAYGACGLPLIGMTVGTDGAWSARFWTKHPAERRVFERQWCETVRVVNKQLSVTFTDRLLKPSFDSGKQLRTISAWGKNTQEDISRLRVGIVGLGSVGSIVAEILARTGVSLFTLIDFDFVENKNLDRTLGVYETDIGKTKVNAISEAINKSATSPNVKVEFIQYSICEEKGFLEALNCDILFSCVDRPWPRQVLNFIAYAHLIPVVDGGIKVRTNKLNTKIIGADWRAHTVGNERVCLECLGQYRSEIAKLESEGYLDDPDYIEGMSQKFQDAHENVFAFSSHLASMEVLQLLNLFIAPSGVSDVGLQNYHFVSGRMDVEENRQCQEFCFFPTILGKGDNSGIQVVGRHSKAEEARDGK
jgi:molybdopterin-synthase adenylyltransferase